MVTEEEWEEAQNRQLRLRFLSCAAGIVILGAVSLPAMALGAAITDGGFVRYLVSAGILIGFVVPSMWAMIFVGQQAAGGSPMARCGS